MAQLKGNVPPAKSAPHNKAKKTIGSGSNSAKAQGHVSGPKVRPGVAKSSIGSGSTAIKPETAAALRNAGC